MTLKAIDELSAAAARDRIARAIGVKREVIGLSWTGHRVTDILVTRKSETPRHLTEPELMAIAEAGVLLGADGWEIEEEPAKPERRPLPAGWTWRKPHGSLSFQALLPVEEVRNGHWIAEAHPSGLWKVYPDLQTDRTIAGDMAEPRTLEAAQEAAERECWERGLIGAPVAADLGAKVGAIHDAAGAPLRALVFAIRNDAPSHDLEARLAAWGESLKGTMRASIPSPRAADGALTAYLLEHYRDEWRTDDTAETLAIRLLGETQAIVDEAHREAEASDASAKEMAAELAKVRAELNAANSRAAEAEHDRDVARDAVELRRVERDEARTDLAVLRGLCRGFAAKIGAPHG